MTIGTQQALRSWRTIGHTKALSMAGSSTKTTEVKMTQRKSSNLQFDLNSVLNWANSATRFVKNNSGTALNILRSLTTGNWPAAAA